MKLARATLQIVRPSSSAIAFFSIFIPVLAKTSDLSLSLRRAIPLLFAGMCTFIINDLDDIEKDKVNHPERPLPSGQLKPAFVAVLYYVCLASALFTTRYWVGTNHIAFLYYLLLVIGISYNSVVEYLPAIKPMYVAGASAGPILVLVAYYPHETSLYGVAAAIFLFMLGRELCKDILDRSGDPLSILHAIEPRRVARFAFASQVAGLVLLSLQIEALLGFLDLLLMTALVSLSYLCWFRLRRLETAITLMKAAIFFGLYFLV